MKRKKLTLKKQTLANLTTQHNDWLKIDDPCSFSNSSTFFRVTAVVVPTAVTQAAPAAAPNPPVRPRLSHDAGLRPTTLIRAR